MFRRILSLILVPVLLANQAVLCCAHSHVDSVNGGQSQRAHIHHSGHSHDSSHNHGDSGDHQHDDSSQSEYPIAELETGDPFEHDHDAIYIGEQVELHLPASRVSIEESTVAGKLRFAEVPNVVHQGHCCQAILAGPLGLYSTSHCAIFLQTRCLLI